MSLHTVFDLIALLPVPLCALIFYFFIFFFFSKLLVWLNMHLPKKGTLFFKKKKKKKVNKLRIADYLEHHENMPI